MKHQAARLYAIQLPDGTWWKRGGGVVPGDTVDSFKQATLYKNVGAAKRAAMILKLEEAFGGWAVMEMILILGEAKIRMG